MTNSLHKVFGYRTVYDEQLGIEVECEFDGNPLHQIGEPIMLKGTAGNHWQAHNDGSLRNGLEFVTRYPVPIKEARPSLEALFARYKTIKFSHRTSIHFHFNRQNSTLVKLYNSILGFWVFEDCIVNLCDPKRHGNQFCLPWMLAEGQITRLVQDFDQKRYFGLINPDDYKYAAMNLANIPKLGTMEFRSLEGTYDVDKAVTISEGINHMLDRFADRHDDPAAMFDHFFTLRDKPDAMLDEYVSIPLRDMIRNRYKQYKDSIRDSMTQLSYAAYLDWGRDKKELPARKKTRAEQMLEEGLAIRGDALRPRAGLRVDPGLRVDWAGAVAPVRFEPAPIPMHILDDEED